MLCCGKEQAKFAVVCDIKEGKNEEYLDDPEISPEDFIFGEPDEFIWEYHQVFYFQSKKDAKRWIIQSGKNIRNPLLLKVVHTKIKVKIEKIFDAFEEMNKKGDEE
jgi:hypothetical protein